MPTIKQRKAIEMVGKGMPITKAMKEAGYAESTSENTTKLTRSNAWNELLSKKLSDDKLLKVLNEGLEADRKLGDELEPDYSVRHKYLETGLKLKSRFPKEESPMFAVQVNVGEDRDKYK